MNRRNIKVSACNKYLHITKAHIKLSGDYYCTEITFTKINAYIT